MTAITAAAPGFGYRWLTRQAEDRTMWLPYRLYEALPKIYVSVGTLILAGALYLGFQTRSVFLYLLLALACIGYGAFITWLRYRYRHPPAQASAPASAEDIIIAMARRFH